ncbi:MAG: 5-oxoprolinase subunit PxpB, partial [Polaromonas sp.]
ASLSALPEARLLPFGDAAFAVEIGGVIEPRIHARVLGFARALERLAAIGGIAGVVEWVPTFRSVTVYFEPDRIDGEALGAKLLALARTSTSLTVAGARWRIPVCFEAEFAPDLDELAAAKAIARERVVELMTQTVFSVYMLGFQPGFSYLGGLPEVLEMPRLASPRKRVPAGSVAVAQRMCAAYPWESPGGWRLLGRTPVPLFDAADAERPALLAPGDQVLWQAVDRNAYEALLASHMAGTFDRASLRVEAKPGGAQP